MKHFFAVFLGCSVLFSGPLLLNAESNPNSGMFQDVLFQLSSVSAVDNQYQVPVRLTIKGLPKNSRISSFGFAVRYNTQILDFVNASTTHPGKSRVYLQSSFHRSNWMTLQFEVYNTIPLTYIECVDVLSLYFWPHYNHEEDQDEFGYGDEADDQDQYEDNENFNNETEVNANVTFLPVVFTRTTNTGWLSSTDTTISLTERNLASGGITLLLKNGGELGTVTAGQGDTVDIPLKLITTAPVRFFDVGMDYDEDMAELLMISPTKAAAPLLKEFNWEYTETGFEIHAEFNNEFIDNHIAILSLFNLTFWVDSAVQAGKTIYIGKRDADIRTEGEEILLYTFGSINVTENTDELFIRGDINGDGRLNNSDAINLLQLLFVKGSVLCCHDAADVNDDGILNIADVSALLAYLFDRSHAPAPPFPEAGLDPTYDELPPCECGN